MVHYIRNEKGDTLLDLEVFSKEGQPDLRSVVNIKNYSNFLLEADDDRQRFLITHVFESLSEARGWYWEVYRATINNKPTKEDTDKVICKMVISGAEVLGLYYVTD